MAAESACAMIEPTGRPVGTLDRPSELFYSLIGGTDTPVGLVNTVIGTIDRAIAPNDKPIGRADTVIGRTDMAIVGINRRVGSGDRVIGQNDKRICLGELALSWFFQLRLENKCTLCHDFLRLRIHVIAGKFNRIRI
jgi:hypothetical protein